jgi:protein FrlC
VAKTAADFGITGVVEPTPTAALREIGYDGYLAMEIGFNRRNVEPDLVARQAFDYLKPLVS